MTKMVLPTAEAKVVVRNFGTEDWRDALDFDPISLPVEAADLNTTDVFNPSLIGLVSALVEAETGNFGTNGPGPEYDVVWSDTNRSVKGCCPLCDDVFPVAEGYPGDELNEGVNALCCGCYDS
jgi:hypothetical protein